MHYVDWLLAVNITYGNTNCCLYRVDPRDDEQQAYSKHGEAFDKQRTVHCDIFVS